MPRNNPAPKTPKPILLGVIEELTNFNNQGTTSKQTIELETKNKPIRKDINRFESIIDEIE